MGKKTTNLIKKQAVSNLLLFVGIFCLMWFYQQSIKYSRTVKDIKVNVHSRQVKPYSEYVFFFWAHDRQMNNTQMIVLEELADHVKQDKKALIFVSIDNVQLFELKDHNLIHALQQLSVQGRRQYIKSYIMNFYGGTYEYLDIQQRHNDMYMQAVKSSSYSTLEKLSVSENKSLKSQIRTVIPMSQFTLSMLQIAQKQIIVAIKKQKIIDSFQNERGKSDVQQTEDV